MRSAVLEWNRPAPIAADNRGRYVAAYRDPARGIPLAIQLAIHGGWIVTLAMHLNARGRSIALVRAAQVDDFDRGDTEPGVAL